MQAIDELQAHWGAIPQRQFPAQDAASWKEKLARIHKAQQQLGQQRFEAALKEQEFYGELNTSHMCRVGCDWQLGVSDVKMRMLLHEHKQQVAKEQAAWKQSQLEVRPGQHWSVAVSQYHYRQHWQPKRSEMLQSPPSGAHERLKQRNAARWPYANVLLADAADALLFR